MKITINLNDDIHLKAKLFAAQSRRTISGVVDNALREYFFRYGGFNAKSARPKLPIFDGKGLRPGIDLDNSDTLLDLDFPKKS
jgi:hypothetical protein